MARPSSRFSIASTPTLQASSTVTTTVNTASSSDQLQPQVVESLVLTLKRPKKKVSWKEGTVDNEFMNKKSSKKCCIFHKQKPFDEDDSETEEDCCRREDGDKDTEEHHGESSCGRIP